MRLPPDKIREVLERTDLAALASRHGVELKKRGRTLLGLCPFHGEKLPSFNVNPEKQFFKCFGCDAKGDAIAFQMKIAGCSFVDAVLELAGEAGVEIDDAPARHTTRPRQPPVRKEEPPRPTPPAAEVEALWGACVRVDRTLVEPDPSDLEAAGFLASRGREDGQTRWWPPLIADLDVARLLPLPDAFDYSSLSKGDDCKGPWWLGGWARTWRLVVPAYEPDGRLASIHARAVSPLADGEPKTRWPYGFRSTGLLMADPRGRDFLRGEAGSAVLVAEGLTDLIAWSLWSHATGRGWPVLSVASGGEQAFKAIRWPPGVVCFVATDNDEKGDKYAANVNANLPKGVDVRRVRLGVERSAA